MIIVEIELQNLVILVSMASEKDIRATPFFVVSSAINHFTNIGESETLNVVFSSPFEMKDDQ